MKQLKYLAAYIIPVLCGYGLVQHGGASWGTIVFAFGLVPLLEYWLPVRTMNIAEQERGEFLSYRTFDWLLYLNIPIVFCIVGLFIFQLEQGGLTTFERIGLMLSTGVVLGASGINVAHELGHRSNKKEQIMAQILLLPSLYQHFYVEHNRGHHKYVATPDDPASARRGEPLYLFWLRSLWGSWKHAWSLEAKRLQRAGKPLWHWDNLMLRFTLVQTGYVCAVFALCSNPANAFTVLGASLTGILLLETINYIEHYGLRRKLLPGGRYEPVQPHHSWNAEYTLGRIMLYELTRHSDHHYLASKKYQVLDYHQSAPELPLGYPGAMLLSLVPPLWFWIMNHRLDAHQSPL